MKKFPLTEIILIFISIPFGILLSLLPNNNSMLAMGQRLGHSFILTGMLTLIINISDKIRKKKHPQTVEELISMDQGMFTLQTWKIVKDNNKLKIDLDKLSHYAVCLVFGLIGGTMTYIILPRIMNFEPSFMFSTPTILTWGLILIDFCCVVIMFFIVLITTHYNIMKIIDGDEKTFKMISRKKVLTIPFSNLNQLKILKNDFEGFFELSIPIAGNSGDLSIIKESLRDDYVVLLRQRMEDKKKKKKNETGEEKGEKILKDIMASITDFIEKYSI